MLATRVHRCLISSFIQVRVASACFYDTSPQTFVIHTCLSGIGLIWLVSFCHALSCGCLVSSRLVPSCVFLVLCLSCLVLYRIVSSCLVMSCLVSSRLVSSCLVLSCPVLSLYFLSLSFLAVVSSCLVLSCGCLVFSCLEISYCIVLSCRALCLFCSLTLPCPCPSLV